MNTVKLTVTVPRDDFRMIEQEKKQQGLTRSALIQKIVEFFFQRRMTEQKIIAYIHGYKKKPEKIHESLAWTSAQMQVFGKF